MRTIWKYSLEIKDEQHLVLPGLDGHDFHPSQIVAVNVQGDIPAIWVMVDTESPGLLVTIHIVGTGASCDLLPREYHIGTVVTHRSFVWHIFLEYNHFDKGEKKK